MSNLTHLFISCRSEAEAVGLYSLIKDWLSRSYNNNTLGSRWLGNIAGNSGIEKWDGDFSFNYNGQVVDYDHFGREVTICFDSEFHPELKMWVKLCEKYSPGAEIIYTIEDSMVGHFQTNDPEYKDRFYLDSWNDKVETNDSISKEALLDIFHEYFGSDSNDLEYYLDLAESEDMDIYQWEYVPIEKA